MIHRRAFIQGILDISIYDMIMKITNEYMNVKLQPHFHGANELKTSQYQYVLRITVVSGDKQYRKREKSQIHIFVRRKNNLPYYWISPRQHVGQNFASN